jgi:hypothetical protein
MRHRMRTDYPDLVIAKRLLDHLKALGSQSRAPPSARMARWWVTK